MEDIKRDETLDLNAPIERADSTDTDFSLSSLIHSSEPEKDYAAEEAEATEEKEAAPTTKEDPEEEHLTELQKAIRAKKKQGTGMVIENEVNDVGPREFRNIHDTDENREGFAEAVQEQEHLIAVGKRIVCVRRPANEMERAEMFTEMLGCTINEDGSVNVPLNSKWITAKTEEIERQMAAQRAREENGEQIPEDERRYTDVGGYINQRAKENYVRIIIDKTGLGTNVTFTEDEKKSIETASRIQIVEVEETELASTSFEVVDESEPFMQTVDAYQLSSSSANMTFPISGFTADMEGMSFGEFADITLNPFADENESLDFDKMNRKFSVIYNKMRNISIGAFKDYNDFLHRFAYADVQVATYGLLIATQPELDKLILACPSRTCDNTFTFEYVPRNLMDMRASTPQYLRRAAEILQLPPKERLKYAMNSPVTRRKRIKLDDRIILDLGALSCYDYLYEYIPMTSSIQDHIPDITEDYMEELQVIMMGVRAMAIRMPDGKHKQYKNATQIAVGLYKMLNIRQFHMLAQLVAQYLNNFAVSFVIRDVRCPRCGHYVKEMTLAIDELVFLVAQAQMGSSSLMFDSLTEL